MLRFGILFYKVLALAIIALVQANSTAALIHVRITNTGYDPISTNIVIGDTVRWVHEGNGFRSTTSDPSTNNTAWDSSTLLPGEAFDYVFEETGTYTYFDQHNPSHRGTIVVDPAIGNRPPTVAITSPISGANFNPGDAVSVQVDANDPDGTIARVVLSITTGGSTTTRTNLEPQSSFVIEDLVQGVYTFVATASDTQGGSGVSSSVSINVGDVQPATEPVITAIDLTTNGLIRLTVQSQNTGSHEILAAPAVTNATWAVIGAAVPTGGSFQFTDTNSVPEGRRFYRIRVAGGGGPGPDPEPGTGARITNLEGLADGQYRVTASTTKTGAHQIHASSTLLANSWVSLGSATPVNGTLTYTDSTAASATRRFYRIVEP